MDLTTSCKNSGRVAGQVRTGDSVDMHRKKLELGLVHCFLAEGNGLEKEREKGRGDEGEALHFTTFSSEFFFLGEIDGLFCARKRDE